MKRRNSLAKIAKIAKEEKRIRSSENKNLMVLLGVSVAALARVFPAPVLF
jgi:hypothetical protein